MDPVIVAFILLFITITVSRMIAIRGMMKLDANEQARMVEVFKKYRLWNLLAMFGFAVIYLSIMSYRPANYLILAYLFLVIVLGLLVMIALNSIKKMRAYNINEDYISTFINSNFVRAAGIAIFFVYILNSV